MLFWSALLLVSGLVGLGMAAVQSGGRHFPRYGETSIFITFVGFVLTLLSTCLEAAVRAFRLILWLIP
jgi:hypothetical protein